MTTIERLLSKSESIWQQYYTHPFVMGIQLGTLPQEKFRRYLLQDYVYLTDYTKVFAIGMAKAKSPESTLLFSNYIHILTHGEMTIHKAYMEPLSMTLEELEQTAPLLDNLSYTSYMLRVAYEEGEAEILAAILSCAVSYEYIGRTIAQNRPESRNDPFYGYWVRGYDDEKCAQDNAELIAMLNKLTAHYTEAQLVHLEDIFMACSQYELAFWNMSWQES